MEVKLYRPREGRKELVGTLKDYRDGDVVLESGGAETVLTRQEIAVVKLYVRI